MASALLNSKFISDDRVIRVCVLEIIVAREIHFTRTNILSKS
jgi:hypothetical protein